MNRRFKMKNKISLFPILALSLFVKPLWANESDKCKVLFNSKAEHVTVLKDGTFRDLPKKSFELASEKEKEEIKKYEQARDDYYRSLEGPVIASDTKSDLNKEKVNIKADQTFIPLSEKLYPTKYGLLTKRGLLHAKGLDPWECPID